MRKIIVLSFITLDGVMQSPGGPEEDKENSFKYGGWSVPYWDDEMEAEMGEEMGHQFDLLLGRKTYDVFMESWPIIDPQSTINSTTKYVVTQNTIPENSEIWKNSVKINGDIVTKIKELKKEDGHELQVHGSYSLVQLLLKEDLVDELWLKIYPVLIGTGKRLFSNGTMPASLKLIQSKATSKGVIIAKYRREGNFETGTF